MPFLACIEWFFVDEFVSNIRMMVLSCSMYTKGNMDFMELDFGSA